MTYPGEPLPETTAGIPTQHPAPSVPPRPNPESLRSDRLAHLLDALEVAAMEYGAREDQWGGGVDEELDRLRLEKQARRDAVDREVAALQRQLRDIGSLIDPQAETKAEVSVARWEKFPSPGYSFNPFNAEAEHARNYLALCARVRAAGGGAP